MRLSTVPLLLAASCLLQSSSRVVAFAPSPPLAFCQHPSTVSSTRLAAVVPGLIVTIDCNLQPEGDFVPEPLVDTSGKLTFVLGGGNYLPGLHDLVSNMNVGEKVEGVSLDAGWGERNPDLVVELSKSHVGSDVADKLKVGVELFMANGLKCTVTNISDDAFTIDANPPLAGASYQATVELLKVEDAPTKLEYIPEGDSSSPYQVATFALGCFWGGEYVSSGIILTNSSHYVSF